MQHCGDRIEFIRDYLSAIFAEDVHAKRIDSLAGATLGVMRSASLAVSVIGHALAQARCRLTKHAIKQVDTKGAARQQSAVQGRPGGGGASGGRAAPTSW